MNFRTTIFLLVLLIIVGGFLYFIEERRGDEPRAPEPAAGIEREGEPLYGPEEFPDAEIASLAIEHKGKTVEIVREGSDWRQTAPVQFALTAWSVEQIGKDAGGLRHVERFRPDGPDARPLKEIGLDPPLATVTVRFRDRDGRPVSAQTLRLGERLMLGGRAYLMRGDDPQVYVVNDALHKQVLDKKFDEFRKKSFDAPQEGATSQVGFTRADRTIQMLKADGNWAFGPPDSGRVDAEKVKTLLSDLGSMYINKFVTDQASDLAVYGLDSPQVTVAIQGAPPAADAKKDAQEGEPASGDAANPAEPPKPEAPAAAPTLEVLRIGGPVDFKDEYFFATRSVAQEPSQVVFTVAKYFVDKLNKSVDDFRDARLTTLPRADIREATIERPGPVVVKLLHADGKWAFGPPAPPYRADSAESDRLVDAIVNARAEAYEAAASPSGDPLALVTLSAIGRPEPDVLKVYAAQDAGRCLVLRNQESTGHLVPRDRLKGLFDPPIALRDRLVLDMAADRIDHVVLTRPDGLAYEFRREIPPPAAAATAAAPAPDAAAQPNGSEAPAPPAEGQAAPPPAAEQGETAAKEQAAPDTAAPAAAPAPPAPGPWALVGHEKFESESLRELLELVLPLRAEQWYEPPVPLGEVVSIALSSTDGDQATVRFEPATRHASAGLKATDIAVEGFVVSPALAAKADAEFRHRTVLEMQDKDIASLTVRRGEAATTVRKEEGGKYVSPEIAELDDAAAGGLYDTVRGLRAERFLDQAPDPAPDEVPVVLVIEPKTGEKQELTVFAAAQLGYLTPARWFRLDAADIKKLTADLSKKQ